MVGEIGQGCVAREGGTGDGVVLETGEFVVLPPGVDALDGEATDGAWVAADRTADGGYTGAEGAAADGAKAEEGGKAAAGRVTRVEEAVAGMSAPPVCESPASMLL